MTGHLVSVIVPAYNAERTIGACIQALCQQAYDRPYEIIVVNDGSTDSTASAAEVAGATVVTIPNSRPAAARNAGIRAAKGDIVCCTDADCIPHDDWLQQITAPFANPSIVACKGAYATRQQQLVARFVQLEYEDKYDLLRGEESIDFIDTYSAAYRREILLANGGFDEHFDYLEDQELSFRLAARGYRMVFQDKATVDHLHSATLIKYLRKKVLIGYWKAQVVRRFPGRAARDSHTPQVMKVQMLLALGSMAALLTGVTGLLLAPPHWKLHPITAFMPALLLILIFFATTIPFLRKAWPKDRPVAIASPLLLFGRAIALVAGYGWGVIFPRRGLDIDSGITGLNYVVKRFFDILGAIVGVIFTLLLWPPIALLIRLDSEGPVLFKQERVGERGQLFMMYKFRSMRANASEQWPELVTALGLTEPVLKLDDDPRLTRVGRFLRRWSLDELPQFWNVLKGQMSLVGPRPEEPRIVAYYTEYHRQRLAVKPGITGPMQIGERADLTLDQRVALDLDYIESQSIGRDLVIILKTIPVILRGKGAR